MRSVAARALGRSRYRRRAAAAERAAAAAERTTAAAERATAAAGQHQQER